MRAALAAATPRVEQPSPAPVTVLTAEGVPVASSDPEDPTVVGAGEQDPTVAVAVGPDAPQDVTLVAAWSLRSGRTDEPTLAVPTPSPVDATPVSGAATGRSTWLVGAGLAALVLVALALGTGGGSLPTAEELATDEVGATEDPVPAPASAGTISRLEALVRAHPDRWGPRAPELADRLAAVAGAEAPAQGEHARVLLGELDGWEAAGELDSELAARTRELVGPLAMVVEEPVPPEERRDPGRGRGRDRGGDRDD
jgi:hypothetical protein